MKKEFSFSLFDLDWEVFSVNIEGAVNRVPAVEKTGIKSTVCGPGMFVRLRMILSSVQTSESRTERHMRVDMLLLSVLCIRALLCMRMCRAQNIYLSFSIF